MGALIPSFVVPINPATLEPFMVDFSRPLKVGICLPAACNPLSLFILPRVG